MSDDVVRKGYNRSLSNFFHHYQPIVEDWAVLDNSRQEYAEPIAEQTGPTLPVFTAYT